MAKYQCSTCGYIFDEEKMGNPFSDIEKCPVCAQPVSAFHLLKEDGQNEKQIDLEKVEGNPLAYPPEYVKSDSPYRCMKEIHQMALTGEPIIEAMGTTMPMPGWEDVLILGAQLDPMPLEADAPVCIKTVIGKHARQPMVLEGPAYISHMSFGALSREVKVALAKGTAMSGTAMCSGEGGILPEEMAAAHKYIFEYVPNKYSVTPENLKNSDAIEIKIGQGTKPGWEDIFRGEGDCRDCVDQRKADREGHYKPVHNTRCAHPGRFKGIGLPASFRVGGKADRY